MTATDTRPPCFIAMRDLLTWPLAMFPHIERLGMRPVLLDHESTYQPLVDYYHHCPYEVRHISNSYGAHGFFAQLGHRQQAGWYAFTDGDLDISAVPDDFVETARQALHRHQWATKVALSLEINDVPPDSMLGHAVSVTEAQKWTQQLPDGNWRAGSGHTLALHHCDRRGDFYTSVRLNRPYTARHLPWYFTSACDVTAEYLYYLSHAKYPAHVYSRILKEGLVRANNCALSNVSAPAASG